MVTDQFLPDQTYDQLFEEGMLRAAEFYVGQGEYLDNLSIATRLRESLESGKPSDKVIPFPASEYILEEGLEEQPDGRYRHVKRLVSRENEDDCLSLLPEDINHYISTLTTKTAGGSRAKLVATFGPITDITRQDALYVVPEGEQELENIYLVLSGAYVHETGEYVQSSIDPLENENRSGIERGDIYRVLITREKAERDKRAADQEHESAVLVGSTAVQQSLF